MNNIRVLHTGDLHIGSSFSTLDLNDSFIRVREHESNVKNMMKQAKDYDIVLLCGDVFDSPDTNYTDIKSFLEMIREADKTLFFMSCGNHDYYTGNSIKYCLENCPANLHIFPADKFGIFTVEEHNLRIYGRSFENQHFRGSMLDDFEYSLDKKYLNLLCMHGEVSESENGLYNSVPEKDILNSGFDYVALGHVHTHNGIKKSDITHYSYCGCIEGRGFDECGAKGYVSLDVSESGISADFVKTCKREYMYDKIDITDLSSYNDIITLIDDIVGENICRIDLIGKNSFCPFINTEYIERSTKSFYMECNDKSYISPDLVFDSNPHSLKGKCAEKTIELINKSTDDDEKDLLARAYTLLYNEFNSE